MFFGTQVQGLLKNHRSTNANYHNGPSRDLKIAATLKALEWKSSKLKSSNAFDFYELIFWLCCNIWFWLEFATNICIYVLYVTEAGEIIWLQSCVVLFIQLLFWRESSEHI